MTQLSPDQRHRRGTYLGIVLPIAGVLLIMILMIGLAIVLLNPVQFSIVADLMAILFILVPYVIMCLIPTLILMAGALGLWAVHGQIARPLRRGRTAAINTLAKGTEYIPQAGKPFIAIQTRLTYWERLLSGRRARVSPEEETKQ